MSKLTKSQRDQLLHTLNMMQRVQAFIAAERTVICVAKDRATCATDYTRADYMPAVDRSPDDAKPLSRIAKDIGSELCCLPTAIRQLMLFLES